MVVNNWYITCNMFCIVTNGIWPRVYFVSFWLAIVLIFMNLLISFVLEIYSDVSTSINKEGIGLGLYISKELIT